MGHTSKFRLLISALTLYGDEIQRKDTVILNFEINKAIDLKTELYQKQNSYDTGYEPKPIRNSDFLEYIL